MGTRLYWFSGTGNSLVAARRLAEEIGDAELLPLAGAAGEGIGDADAVGLVFPVYAFGPPLIVAEFVRQLPAAPGTYVFAVATMGGVCGATHSRLRRALKSRGLSLAAGWTITLPGNNVRLYGPRSKKTQKKMFARCEERVPEIAAAVRDRACGACEDSVWPVRMLASALYPVIAPRFLRNDRIFRVQEHCTSCGLCERICPVQNVKLTDGRPQWQGHCEQCMACLQWCPQGAIQFGNTAGQARYHHPEITVSDMLRMSP